MPTHSMNIDSLFCDGFIKAERKTLLSRNRCSIERAYGDYQSARSARALHGACGQFRFQLELAGGHDGSLFQSLTTKAVWPIAH